MSVQNDTRSAMRRRQQDRATLLMEQAVSQLLDIEEFDPTAYISKGEVADLARQSLDAVRSVRSSGGTAAPTVVQ